VARGDIKIILAPFAGRTRKIDRTNAKFECSTAALIFGYCDRSVTFAVLVFGDRRNLPLNSVFRADLRRFYLLANRCNRNIADPFGYFFDTKNRLAQYRLPSSCTAKNRG
jgi:hypothetical protein